MRKLLELDSEIPHMYGTVTKLKDAPDHSEVNIHMENCTLIEGEMVLVSLFNHLAKHIAKELEMPLPAAKVSMLHIIMENSPLGFEDLMSTIL